MMALQKPITNKQIDEKAKETVANLEHLLTILDKIEDYPRNYRYYRCTVCGKKLSQHKKNISCLYPKF